MEVYHGSIEMVPNPEIRKSRFNKDFYFGFYCTLYKQQAERWAKRFGKGVINFYEYSENPKLKVLLFPEMCDEWLDFIAACRSGSPHNYDIVEGPMADDQVYSYVEDFLEGTISRAAFWELAKFKYPTHQISFHTEAALSTLRFLKGEYVTS